MGAISERRLSVFEGEIKKAKEGKNYSEALPLKIDSFKKEMLKV
jgi:hypothetical protein